MPVQETDTGIIIKTKSSQRSELLMTNKGGEEVGVGIEIDGRLIPDPVSLSVLPATKAAGVGDVFKLEAYVLDSDGESYLATTLCNWVSGTPTSVNVKQNGECTALATTGSTITATFNLDSLGTLSDTCVVTVT